MNKLKAVFISGIFACIFAAQIFAEPVPIVDEHGREISEQLQDRGLLEEDSLYYIKDGTRGITQITGTCSDITKVKQFFFKKGGEGGKYVSVDKLENSAVREAIHGVRSIPPAYKNFFKILKLCAKIYDESISGWEEKFKEIRRDNFGRDLSNINANLKTTKDAIIVFIFDDISNNSIIQSVKTINIDEETTNWDTDNLLQRYALLKICFHKNRANGDTKKALNFLFGIENIFNPSNEEKKVIDDNIRKFTNHITKHFVHHTIINENQDAFFQGIETPKKGSKYSFFSYGNNSYNSVEAKARVSRIYKKIIRAILDNYDAEFDFPKPRTGEDTNNNHLIIKLKDGKQKLITTGSGQYAKYERIKDSFTDEMLIKDSFTDEIKNKKITPKVYQIGKYILDGNKHIASTLEPGGINNSPIRLQDENTAVFFSFEATLKLKDPNDYSGSLYPL